METNDRHWLINAGLVTSSIIAITANSFLLLIFCRRRGLRTIPNRFIINLLITNLLSSILLIPFLIVDQEFHQIKQSDDNIDNRTIIEFDNNNTMIIHEEIIDTIETNNNNNSDNNLTVIQTNYLFSGDNNSDISDNNLQNTVSPTLCIAAQSTTNFVCTLSILSILLIGINQYFGVIHSLHYHFYINKSRSTIFIITIWLIALLFCCLSIITNSGNTLWYFCYHDNNNNGDNHWYFTPETMKFLRIFNQIYIFVYFILIILAPFVAICIIYLCIYKAAHKNSERMRKSTSTNFEPQQQQSGTTITTTDKTESVSDFLSLGDDLAPPPQQQQQGVKHFITTLKHKLSNASMFRYREETRAAKISILVIILVLICYLPYGLILILNSTIINIKIPNIFNILSLVLLVFSNILSPFLFAYRNKRVKREILKIFGCCNNNNNNNNNICNNNNNNNVNNNKLVMPQIQLEQDGELNEPFLVPEVIVTYRLDTEKKSILKRVCDTATTNWTNYKKCSFIQVPTSCLNTDNTRGSFSSASTQISNED